MNFICDGSKYTVVVKNQPFHFDSSHDEYTALLDALKMNNESEFLEIMTVGQQLADWAEDGFACKEGVITYEGEELAPVLQERLVRLMKNGFSCRPLMAFIKNLYENPSNNSVLQLYKFLEHRSLVITDDGFFIAYKSLATYTGPDKDGSDGRPLTEGDLVDRRTMSIRNNVGDTPTMPRRLVSDNPGSACSTGFHAGSFDFAQDFGGDCPIVLVKINPKDVVSVPNDSSCKKVRVCDYEVVAQYGKEEPIDKEVLDNDDILSYDAGDDSEDEAEDMCSDCHCPESECECFFEDDDDFEDDEDSEY